MSKTLILNLALGASMLVGLLGLWANRIPGRPTGNVKGTRLAHSEGLRRVNCALLAVFVAACAGALLVLNGALGLTS